LALLCGFASLIAAALILATCKAENPPAPVAQSSPGLALQKGQVRLIGLGGISVLHLAFVIWSLSLLTLFFSLEAVAPF
jgi:hypothetical protein